MTDFKDSTIKLKVLIKLITPQGDENADYFLCNFIYKEVPFNRKVWSVWEYEWDTKQY